MARDTTSQQTPIKQKQQLVLTYFFLPSTSRFLVLISTSHSGRNRANDESCRCAPPPLRNMTRISRRYVRVRTRCCHERSATPNSNSASKPFKVKSSVCHCQASDNPFYVRPQLIEPRRAFEEVRWSFSKSSMKGRLGGQKSECVCDVAVAVSSVPSPVASAHPLSQESRMEESFQEWSP